VKLEVDAITVSNAMSVRQAGRAAMQGGDRVIDFSRVARCDTSAVACVIAWLRAAHAQGSRLELVSVPKDLRSLARLYGVEALITGS
jgi:phospholipid transport system transporter-binding protein